METDIDLLLEKHRKEIDIIDENIVKLLSSRFHIVKAIGKIKKKNNIDPYQPWRWDLVLKKIKNNWSKYNVSEDLLIDIWNLLHKEALRIEED